MGILKKIRSSFDGISLRIEENEKLYFILCILILFINVPLTILELEGDNFLVNSIIVIDLILLL